MISPEQIIPFCYTRTEEFVPVNQEGSAMIDSGRIAPNRWRWLAFAAVLAASVMDLLDSTIAGVAAPAIRHDLGGSYADLQWISAGYGLAMAVVLLIGGRLGDLFGRKRILLAGVAGFTLSSLACAGARSPEMLVAARALQGAFGAVMLPQAFGLIRDLFPPAEMPKVWGIFGPAMSLSAILGPIVAGLLIGADVLGTGWRMIFLVNLPIGASALLVGARFLPAVPPAVRSARLDVTGMALAAAAAFTLVYPLVQGRELGWPAWAVLMLAGSVALFAAFGVHQVARRRRGLAPLVEPSVFARRAYTSGLGFALVFCAAMGGASLTLTVLLQIGLGYSPLHASLTTATWGVGAFAGSALAGMTMVRLGRRILHAGLVVMAAGLAAAALVVGHAGPGMAGWELAAPLLVSGVGMGMIFGPLFEVVMSGVAPHEMGSGSSVLQSVNGLGGSLGVAGLGTLFFGIAGRTGGVAVFVQASELTLLVSIGLLAVAFLVCFLLPAGRSHGAPRDEAAEQQLAA
jgi:EmrB/QacA subfamily drug resistance transporter